MAKYVGESIKRVEDPRFIQGRGAYLMTSATNWPMPPSSAALTLTLKSKASIPNKPRPMECWPFLPEIQRR